MHLENIVDTLLGFLLLFVFFFLTIWQGYTLFNEPFQLINEKVNVWVVSALMVQLSPLFSMLGIHLKPMSSSSCIFMQLP